MKAIRNAIAHSGTAPSTRELMRALDYKSTYSVLLILENLIKAKYIQKIDGKIKFLKDLENESNHGRTISVPLIGIAPCGNPLLAEQNVEAMIPVSTKLAKPSSKYFLLRAIGDSMNLKGITNGDLVLVRQQNTAENGDIVVALIDDEATIKEFERKRDVVLLKPKSKNKNYKPIILTDDFLIQGKVVTTIGNFIDY